MSKFKIDQNGGFIVIDVNAILTLQLRPRYGHFANVWYKKMEKSSPSIYRDVHALANNIYSGSVCSANFDQTWSN